MKSIVIRGLYWKLIWAFAALGVVLVVGTIGYRILAGDRYSWFDGFYMTFITLTTIGYGEIIDLSQSPVGRLFTVIIGTAGLGTLWFMFSTLTVLILEGDINQTLRRRRMEKDIKKLSGHYIVCGYGRVGRNVAAELEATNRRFVTIDEDLSMLEEQKEKNPELLFLHGDASDDDLLLSADITDAAGVFAVTGDDSRNLMIALTAKQLNPAVRVVARCHEMRNVEKLRKAGADATVSPDFTGGKRIASAMVRPTVQTFLDEMLRSEQKLRVEEVTVPAGFASRAFGELQLQAPDYVILALRRGGEWIFNPADDCQLEPGNILILMASPHGRLTIEKQLARTLG